MNRRNFLAGLFALPAATLAAVKRPNLDFSQPPGDFPRDWKAPDFGVRQAQRLGLTVVDRDLFLLGSDDYTEFPFPSNEVVTSRNARQ